MSDKSEDRTDDELTETEIVESVPADFVSLLNVEEADAEEGVVPVRIIQPGWGSSGFYSVDVLKSAVESGTFDNAHMHWDHRGQGERPERSALKWAGNVLEGSAKYQDSGPEGAGVYGKAYVFPHWRTAVESMRSHIGLSIVGKGQSKYGSKNGRSGPIFESLKISDVDFVTRPGAGGKITKQFAGFAESKPTSDPVTESEPPMPETKTTETETPAVEAMIEEAVNARVDKIVESVNAKLEELTESNRMARNLDTARMVVDGSSLPGPAAERVKSSLAGVTQLAAESADPVKIANDAVEVEMKYIEQLTPMHLRKPSISESDLGDEGYEKSLSALETEIFGELEDDKE